MADNLHSQFHGAYSATYKTYVSFLRKWHIIPVELTRAVKLLASTLEADEVYSLLRKLGTTNSDLSFSSSCDAQAGSVRAALDAVSQSLELKTVPTINGENLQVLAITIEILHGNPPKANVSGGKSVIKRAVNSINVMIRDISIASENFLPQLRRAIALRYSNIESKRDLYAYAREAMEIAFAEENFRITSEKVKELYKRDQLSKELPPNTLDLNILRHSGLPGAPVGSPLSMEVLGRDWATTSLQNKPVHEVLDMLVNALASNDSLAIDKVVPSTESGEYAHGIASMVERVVKKPTFRFAVCGFMSHGKSTVINQLIGQDVLNSQRTSKALKNQ